MRPGSRFTLLLHLPGNLGGLSFVAMKQQGQSGAGARSSRDLKADATRYAARYLGVTAAERLDYQELGVDPYTNNELLRKTVHHLAKVDATVNLGMHFVGIPGVP